MNIDPHSLRFFVTRWLNKARYVRSRDGLAAFDKFMFTYIAFNTLYNTAAYVVEGQSNRVTEHMWSRGGLGQPGFPKHKIERTRASRLVVDIGGEQLVEAILRKRNDIKKICGCFSCSMLYLHELPNGEPDYVKDQTMIDKIGQGNVTELLVLIYMVRCNFFHGEKALSCIQNTLLISCKNILAIASEHLLRAIETRVPQQ